MSTEVFIPGIAEFDANHIFGAPAINDTYRESLSRLVLLQDCEVTHFYGCELDLDEDKTVWMSPVEVDDGEHYSYFQILYVNTTPQEAFNDNKLPVSLLEIDEASYKLTPAEHPGYEQLMSHFIGGKKHVLIRHCNTGMAYYPRSITPAQDQARSSRHLEKIIATTGLHEPEMIISLSKPSEKEDISIKTSMLETVHARKYPFAGGEVHSYGLVLDNDPWKYYEIFTPRRIEEMSSKDLLVRIDSGCDIGQIYDDKGCDCREQLHTALTDIQERGNGVVIHIPSQDGRGFGAATKMETEGLKRGMKVATNHDDLRAVDTITAAQLLLGAEFDIRTYEGAGRLLGMIGVESVLLQTDNRLKAEGLMAGGIFVTRRPTNTTGARGALHHIEAKHRHGDIYYGKDSE
jgi:GTP cyclohydrolase II